MKPYKRAKVTRNPFAEEEQEYCIEILMWIGVDGAEHVCQLHTKNFTDALLIANSLAETVIVK